VVRRAGGLRERRDPQRDQRARLPDAAAGSNDQGMCLFFEGKDDGALIHHNDQFRACSGPTSPNQAAKVSTISIPTTSAGPYEGEGLKPAGYGYDSIEPASAPSFAGGRGRQSPEKEALACRREFLKGIDDKGIIATPANSYINELVMEAGRLSIQNNGRVVKIRYKPSPAVAFAREPNR